MILRIVFAMAVSLAVIACGVKSNLEPPAGAMTNKQERDPSRPPTPIGQ